MTSTGAHETVPYLKARLAPEASLARSSSVNNRLQLKRLAGLGAAALGLALGAPSFLHLASAVGQPAGVDGAPALAALAIQNIQTAPRPFDPAAPVRCYVDASYAGRLPLASCAARNGQAARGLDVGLDVAVGAAAAVYDLPASAPNPSPTPIAVDVSGPAEAVAVCSRRTENGWEDLPGELTARECGEALLAGACGSADEPPSGRWGERLLRLTTGRVEIARAGGGYRKLIDRASDCSPPET